MYGSDVCGYVWHVTCLCGRYMTFATSCTGRGPWTARGLLATSAWRVPQLPPQVLKFKFGILLCGVVDGIELPNLPCKLWPKVRGVVNRTLTMVCTFTFLVSRPRRCAFECECVSDRRYNSMTTTRARHVIFCRHLPDHHGSRIERGWQHYR